MNALTQPEIENLRKQIVQGLSARKDDTVWTAVQTALQFQTYQEIANALAPTLTDEQRHYNAGRAAGLEDLRAFLDQLWKQAH